MATGHPRDSAICTVQPFGAPLSYRTDNITLDSRRPKAFSRALVLSLHVACLIDYAVGRQQSNFLDLCPKLLGLSLFLRRTATRTFIRSPLDQPRQPHHLDVRLAMVLAPQDKVAVLDLGHLEAIVVAAYRLDCRPRALARACDSASLSRFLAA